MNTATIVQFNGSWHSGLASLTLDDDIEGRVTVHCDNGPTARALIGAFDCHGEGHRIDNSKLRGQRIAYSTDDLMGLLEGFTPIDEEIE